MPLFGPPNIEKLKRKGDVKGLIKALSYGKDKRVRKAAAEALGQIGESAVEPLIASLKDNEVSAIRYWLDERGSDDARAEALGKIGSERAVEPLIEVAKDKSAGERLAAIEALGKIGDERAVKPLTAALKDKESGPVRWCAAEALGRIGDARAVKPLMAALKDKESSVRRRAAEALGKIGNERAAKALIAALSDDVESVHRAASEALKEIGAFTAETLGVALKDKAESVKAGALMGLQQLGNVGPLVGVINDESADPLTRAAALKVLKMLDPLGWQEWIK